MDNVLGQAGAIQVIPPAQLEAQLAQQASDKAALSNPPPPTPQDLVSYIRGQF